MHSISESIKTIGSIIDGLTIEETKIAQFREQHDKITLKSRNPNFYLSTVGDFSSGKSTLINTLIKQKLLKVAHAATTAVPTYIHRGTGERVVVNVKCNDGSVFDMASQEDVEAFEAKYGTSLPQQIDERISLLTADRTLSLGFEAVDIELPADALADGLCIIDTPGINPGADFAEKHADITKYILDEVADAVIILFPADQAYTQSFEKFLKDNAEYFMKDAIFVVTMMDRVDEEEREDVIRFVKTNLRNNFRLKDPQVLSCSAMLAGKDPYWAAQFEEFRCSLMERLAKNRQRILTEKLIRLSNELLISIQTEILGQKEGFEKRLTVLREHSVPNLRAVLVEYTDRAVGELGTIKRQHDDAVKYEAGYLKNRILQKVSAALSACDTRSGITKYVNDYITKDIESACNGMCSASSKHTEKLNRKLTAVADGMIRKLQEYYGEIGGVFPEHISGYSMQQISVGDKIMPIGSMIGEYENKIDIATALGGAGLAAIFLTGLGPVGWVVGGVAALVGGDRMFLDSTRGKVVESVTEKIPEITQTVQRGLIDGMQTNFSNAARTLRLQQNKLVRQYQPVYEELEGKFHTEEQQLTGEIRRSEETQGQIRKILQQLKGIQGEIAE